ncbi:hypothetical protein LLEC1_07417, partial [Akanthomyces lecanii]
MATFDSASQRATLLPRRHDTTHGVELQSVAARDPASRMPAAGPAACTADDKEIMVTVRQDTGDSSYSESSQKSAVSYVYERFHRGQQLRRLLIKSLSRWLITVVLSVSIYGVLLAYSSHDALPLRKKLEFNTLVIGLTISLGLNIASSLKANAMELQWWLLSLRRYKPREADLIMSSEQFTTMLQLGWTTRHTLIQIFVTVFVTMNIVRKAALYLVCAQGSQIALALLGITYNVNPAEKFAVTTPGLVSIADLSDIQGPNVLATSKNQNLTVDVNSRRYSANMFGQLGLSYSAATMDDVPRPGALYYPELPQLYVPFYLPYDNGSVAAGTGDEGDGHTYSYTYFFFESTPVNASYYSTVATNRSVTVTA